jgi:hypothetical protein
MWNPTRKVYEMGPRPKSIGKAGTALRFQKYRRSLRDYLCRAWSMSKHDACVLAKRPYSQIRTMFENLDSLIDNLALYDETLFRRDNRKMLRNIVPKILKVSTYGVTDVISQWKDFVQHYTATVCETVVESPHVLHGNLFRKLYKYPEFSQAPLDCKRRAENLAHLISTRNLANGGRKEERKAIETFKEITSTAVHLDDTVLQDHRDAGRYIGNILLSIGHQGFETMSHVSLTASGSIDAEVKAGGMATEAKVDIFSFANGLPDPNEFFGKAKNPYTPGIPRWKTHSGIAEWENASFFSEKLGKILDREVELWGADKELGELIHACAMHRWREWKGEGFPPLPVRQVTVSEPGGKARIVTCGLWWVQVAQQPYCHYLCETLARHPAAYSVMLRADQAWQSLKAWEKYPCESLIEGHAVLSSDLKSATDTVDHNVARVELEGLMEVLKEHKDLDEVLISFMGPRLVNYPDHSITVTRRGIPMGEPLAKPVLILLGLCVECIALAKYLGKPVLRNLGSIPSWRVFHLGGDDHIAAGPPEYLNGITTQHRRVGGIVSGGKHGLSRVAVVFTEKLLYFRGQVINVPMNKVDSVYPTTIFIDSIKIRNISPFRKGCERENEVSSYIGKCKAVAASVVYLKGELQKKGRIAISRLRYRFQRNLPDTTHRTLSAIVAMPVSLGGLGLTANLQRSAENLPEIFRKAYKYIIDGLDRKLIVRRLLTGMWSPQAKRGIRTQSDKYLSDAEDQILDQFDSFDIVELRRRLDPEGIQSNAWIFKEARRQKIYTVEDLNMLIEKPYIVRKILEGKNHDNSLRVAPIKYRVARAWEKLEGIPEVCACQPIELDKILAASKVARDPRFLDLSETTSAAIDESGDAVDITGDNVDWEKVTFIELTLYELLHRGSPSLSVRI